VTGDNSGSAAAGGGDGGGGSVDSGGAVDIGRSRLCVWRIKQMFLSPDATRRPVACRGTVPRSTAPVMVSRSGASRVRTKNKTASGG